ncbi:MAG: methyltransferase [Alphaproteobacteria bacterium]|nr:methyltransferase [Alphaproteobacteria bacterium]MBO4643403.1 methyltransferase [Alphaproteobacteria bacterium]
MLINNIIVLLALFIGLGACVFTLYFFITYLRSGFGKYPPFVCSLGKAKKIVIQEAEKILQEKKDPVNVADLGCGSGSLLIPLAKKFPQHHFIGYDWDIVPYLIAKFRSRKLPNVHIYRRNFMKESYGDMQLIMCYTGESLSAILGEKLNQEISKDALIVSETFELGSLRLKEKIQTDTLKIPTKVFIYQKNAD